MRRTDFTCFLIVTLSAVSMPNVASAQIINTLRGFADAERGWSGGAAINVSLAEGNTEYVDVDVNAKIQLQSTRQRWRLIVGNGRRTAQGIEIAKSQLGHFRHNLRLLPRVSSITFVQGQYNPFLRIQRRILIGFGARFEVVESESWQAALGLTAMRESEKLTSNSDMTTTKARASSFVTVYRKNSGGVDLDLWAFYQPVLDEFADFRATGAASMKVKIVGGVHALVRYVISYDKSPPEGVEERDQTLRTGLVWNF